MMKKVFAISLAFAIVAGLLAGCQKEPADDFQAWKQNTQNGEECRISARRTGIFRQGILSLENGFECTETGSYFMCSGNDGNNYLLYSDHGSDTVVKLCGRPDCDHKGDDCNANFGNGCNICYYNGKLYAVEEKHFIKKLVQMDPDGTNRKEICNISKIAPAYSEEFDPRIWNGIFSICLTTLNEEGEKEASYYYYKLDGSMDTFEKAGNLFGGVNDGDNFLYSEPGENLSDPEMLYAWEPGKEESTFLGQCNGSGYVGTDAAYDLRDGVIYEYDYEKGETELLNTGLDGNLKLDCFPDCLVVTQKKTPKEGGSSMYFYNWKFENIGSIRLGSFYMDTYSGYICGETADRIMLTNQINAVPVCYIEKSEFGTDNIQLHPYKLIDCEDMIPENAEGVQ